MQQQWKAPRRQACKMLSIVLCGLMSGGPPMAAAQGTSYGSGGSITTRFIDVKTGEEVFLENLRAGQQVRVEARAFDGMGRSMPCEGMQVNAIQGITGDQLRLDGPVLQFGRNFGSAEFTVSCKNLPDVQYKHAMYNRPPLGQAAREAAAQPAPAPAPAAASSAGGAALGVTALVLGGLGVAAAVAAAGSGGSSNGSQSGQSSCSSGQFCRTSGGVEGCCPNGGFMRLCAGGNSCVSVEPFTSNACPGEVRSSNCCGGAVDCGINRR